MVLAPVLAAHIILVVVQTAHVQVLQRPVAQTPVQVLLSIVKVVVHPVVMTILQPVAQIAVDRKSVV